MQPRIYWILATTAVILAGCNGATEKEQNSKERTSGSTPYLDDADLYLDDQDAFEGSGRGGGEVRDDLEASGSGLGPDDEDGVGGGHGADITNRIDTVRPPVEPKVLPPVDDTITKTKTTSIQTGKQPDPEIGVIQTGEDESDRSEEEDIHQVYIMNPKQEDRASSFFAQPGVLAAVIGGAVVGLLCAILVVMFIVYRMRKKDEGSYALDEPRRSPAASAFPKPGAPHHNREFYA